MNTYSIAIKPSPGIGYCYVSIGDTANHALANLSHQIRMCIKAGVSGNNDSTRLEEVLRLIRKPWRYTERKPQDSWGKVPKVLCVPIKAMAVSYDQPLIPFNPTGTYWCLYHTGRNHEFEEIPARRKPGAKDARP